MGRVSDPKTVWPRPPRIVAPSALGEPERARSEPTRLSWTALAARLSSRGKPTCVVIAAVANRWIRWLFHQMQPSCLAA